MDKVVESLIEKAKQIANNAYAPYSKFRVGCALITEKGNVFVGCNVENASYGATICAERNAITTAIAEEGTDMIISKIAVVTSHQAAAPPCGVCRQVISEFANYQDNETEIIFLGVDDIVVKKVSEILPYKFEF
jgi:cytidine deaminase